jgi:DNA-binding MarR family transcriptional regulator
MPEPIAGPSMRQKIFSLNLDVETVSLYLLCCAVADAGAAVTVEALADKWNGDQVSLKRELKRLEQKNIIRRKQSEAEALAQYQLIDDDQWS